MLGCLSVFFFFFFSHTAGGSMAKIFSQFYWLYNLLRAFVAVNLFSISYLPCIFDSDNLVVRSNIIWPLLIIFSLEIDAKQNYLIMKRSLLGLTQICRGCLLLTATQTKCRPKVIQLWNYFITYYLWSLVEKLSITPEKTTSTFFYYANKLI